ncbi:CRISPR-associated endonuclease Cas1 [Thermincola ferriacetica]
MSVVYITEQGAYVKRSGQRIIVVKGKTVLKEIPVHRIERILLFGNIQVTTQALNILMTNGIDVMLLSRAGRFKGSLVSADSKNIYLRIAQHKLWHDKSFRLNLAKNLVFGKIRNQLAMLRRFRKNHPEEDFGKQMAILEQMSDSVGKAGEVSVLMGIEGMSSAAYFECFARMNRSDLDFGGRQKHPARDHVNAMLNLGYVMITNEVCSILMSMSFDVFLGFLHGIRYGRRSLALDLVEQFRQPLVDSLILKLINRGVFCRRDFETHDDGRVELNDDAFKRFLVCWSREMEHAAGTRKKSWRDIIIEKCEELEGVFMDRETYRPFEMRS